VRAGVVLVRLGKMLSRRGSLIAKLSDDEMFDLFRAYREGQFAKEGWPDVLEEAIRRRDRGGERASVGELLDALGFKPVSEDGVRGVARVLVRKTDFRSLWNPGSVHRHLMGAMMAELKGRADGSVVAAILEEELGKRKDAADE
jgi:glutamyl-tRNA(Gln) amidotransferase subunit E